jgi:hypothetical protein
LRRKKANELFQVNKQAQATTKKEKTMSYKQIIRMRDDSKEQMGGQINRRSSVRKPLKVSTRQWATQLLRGRLTTRDLELVRALIGVGMLTRHQIQRLFFGDQTKLAANRLTKLYHYHFLDRSTYWLEEMGVEGFEPCYIYTLGAAGLEVFALRMGMKRQEVPFTPARYTLSRENHFLLHDLQISEMFTRLGVAAKQRGMELLWYNESATILRQDEAEIVRPDGLGVLVGQERQTPFFVEMDRGNTDWAHKVAAYERARRQSEWQQALYVDGWRPVTFPAVLCVTPTNLARTATTIISQAPGQTAFYLKTWERFLTTDILADWYNIRAGQVEALLPGIGGETSAV